MNSKGSTGGVTLDSVVIEIESKANGAYEGIDNLSRSLANLKEAIKFGFNNLKQLSESLTMLNEAAPKLKDTTEQLSNLTKIAEALKPLNEIPKPEGLSKAVQNLQQLPGVFDKITPDALQNVARVSNELADSLSPLAAKLSEIGQGYSAINMLANRYGVSVTKIRDDHDKLSNSISNTNKKLSTMKSLFGWFGDGIVDVGKKSVNWGKKMASQIKQIGLSLLGTRTIFTLTRKAVSEYMQLDEELTKTTQNLWRALGAQLAPAIEYVLYLFKQIVRVIYSVIYALTGIDLIARANAKALASMGKSAKDALASLQKFDDLNVAEFDKGNGDDNLIELDKIDLTPIQKVIDWMKKLKEEIKEAWSSGEWGGVATTFLGGIADGIDAIPWYEIGTKIREAIEKIPWKEIWDGIVDIAKESFKGLTEFINGLFGEDEDSKFGENLLISLLGIYAVIQLIKGVNGLGGILESLGLISEAPAFATIAGLFGGILVIVLSIKQTLDTWGEFFENPTWKTGWDVFFDTLLAIAGVIAGIALLFGAWPVALIAALAMVVILVGKFLYENLDAINNWFYNLGKNIGDWFSEQWDKIKKWWNGMTKDAKNAAASLSSTIGDSLKGGIEWAINKIIDGFNWVKKQLNKFSFDVPDWVPGMGGQKWGFNLKMSDYVKLETGTNEIQYEGLYHLHEGEAVVPKKYNPALGNGGTDEEVGQKLDTLIAIMNTMNFTNVVNIGNETLYKKQQAYNKKQNDKYGTTVNL